MYNPQIGDGRGFLFVQLRDSADRLLDLGTKGSGQTPYSRFGDGRLTLKGDVREVLATEMLESLGVQTSKTFSLIETGGALDRNDEPSPTRSAVLVRLQHSHIRIGTFQRLAYHDLTDEIAQLTDIACVGTSRTRNAGRVVRADCSRVSRRKRHVWPPLTSQPASSMACSTPTTSRSPRKASTTARGAGRPIWDGGFTAAYFDHAGLYAFGRQPEAIGWNVHQLALCLRLIAEPDELIPALELYTPSFKAELRRAICSRLGVAQRSADEDDALLAAIEAGLTRRTVTIDRFFFDWRGGRLRNAAPTDLVYTQEAFSEFRRLVEVRSSAASLDHAYWADGEPCSMHIEEVEAIWSAIDRDDDWAPLEAKVAAIRRMNEALTSKT